MTPVVIAALVAGVVGLVGGALARGVSADRADAGATTAPAFPSTFPQGSHAVLPGLHLADLQARLERAAYTCAEQSLGKLDTRGITYCSTARATMTFSLTHRPNGDVEKLQIYCPTKADAPTDCRDAVTSLTRIPFAGLPQYSAQATSWVRAHANQNAAAVFGPVDVVVNLSAQTVTFSGGG